MLVYSLQEILLIVILATAVDWLIGDPKRLVHPRGLDRQAGPLPGASAIWWTSRR